MFFSVTSQQRARRFKKIKVKQVIYHSDVCRDEASERPMIYELNRSSQASVFLTLSLFLSLLFFINTMMVQRLTTRVFLQGFFYH